MDERYSDFCAESDLLPGQSRGGILKGWPVLVCRVEAGVFAVINRCTHADSQLVGGRVARGTISCPLHGARFDLASGRCLGAHYQPLKTFAIRVEDGRIAVAVPDEAPGYMQQPMPAPLP
jgi:nitrite reductase/ring-hydroxylating ferredoxin subunit